MEKVKLLLHQHKHSNSDFEYYHLHIEKVNANKSTNPDIAIETCKSLIEGVSKSVLKRLDNTFDEKKETTGKNPRSVQWFFKKSLEKIAEKSEDFEATFVASSGQIINIISEIRTKRGDISHGKSVPKKSESSPEFAEMVVNMTDLIVSYTLKHFFHIDTIYGEKLNYFTEVDAENLEGDIPKEMELNIKYNTYLDDSEPDFPISKVSYSQLLFENDYDEYETRYFDEFLKTLEKEEDEETTEEEVVPVPVEKEEQDFVSLTNQFDETTFWTKENLDKLLEFIQVENLIEANTKKLIEEYLFTENPPFPDDVKASMVEKPSLLQFRKIKEELTQKIVEFAQTLKPPTND